MKLQTESEKLDELSMEETDEKSGASGRENGTEPLKPWMMALIFLGLAVTAAVICVIIWRFTHSDKPEGSGSLPSSEMAQGLEGGEEGEKGSAAGQESGIENEGENGQEPGNTAGISSSSEPDSEKESSPEHEADQDIQEPETGAGSETGAGTGGENGTGMGTGSDIGTGVGSGTGSGVGTGTGAGNGTGTGTGSGTGTGVGSGTGSGAGTGTGGGNGTGTGTGSDTGTGVGSGTGSGAGTGTGAGNGTGTDVGSGTGTGTGAENGTGTETGSGAGTGAGTETGTGTGAGAGEEPEGSAGNSAGQEAGAGTGAGASQGSQPMTFDARQDSVTPKELVNLRSAPTTKDPANIVTQAKNGEVLARTGINEDSGWSRIDYNGQTLYAVTQNLSIDLNYTPPVQAADPNQLTTADGRVIVFKNCDEWVTPKEYANLRTEPSTSQGDSTVSCRLNYGERAHRTGWSEDTGWSRVEYNGQVLYVVSSLVFSVEEAQQ